MALFNHFPGGVGPSLLGQTEGVTTLDPLDFPQERLTFLNLSLVGDCKIRFPVPLAFFNGIPKGELFPPEVGFKGWQANPKLIFGSGKD